MASGWNSSTSSGQNPNANPNPTSLDQSLDAIEDQLASIALDQPNEVVADEESSEQEVFKDAPNGSLLDEENHHDATAAEIGEVSGGNLENELSGEAEVVEEEVRGSLASGSGAWRRNNSELEVDQASSPSSSGYAGERGTSASSASGIEEVGDDEICEVGNNNSSDGLSDLQGQWVPGKRHVDEVSKKQLNLLCHFVFSTLKNNGLLAD